jgi:hypothetical protein
MRRGTDFDHVHPNCTDGIATGNCYLPPVNGDLLQVMRWPFFQNMTDHDLRAIYEYLSAIPCNPGPGITDAPYLQNACEQRSALTPISTSSESRLIPSGFLSRTDYCS